MVEQQFCKLRVVGSIPTAGSIFKLSSAAFSWSLNDFRFVRETRLKIEHENDDDEHDSNVIQSLLWWPSTPGNPPGRNPVLP